MKRLTGAVLFLLVMTGPSLASPEDVANDISKQIMSPYCPGVTLHDCASGAAADLRSDIAGWAADGWSKKRILDHLEAEFGDSVRATPPSSGAGLLAWVLPALAVIVGGATVTYVVTTWSKRRELPSTPSISADERARLDAELKKLEPGT